MKQQLDHIIEMGPFNGVVMIYQANVPLYVRAYGFSDFKAKIPLDIDDQFMVGSLTKQITAMTILNAVPDTQALALGTSCSSTFHELLSHTSGINDDAEQQPISKGQFSYSSKGYTLLAQALEHHTQETFDESLKRICKAAGMYHTSVQPQGTEMDYDALKNLFPRLVKSYNENEIQEYTQGYPRVLFKNAAGGLISRAKDLIFWNEALHEKKIWGERNTDLLQTPQSSFGHRWGQMSYGYGLEMATGKIQAYSHSGILRGFLSTLLYYPALNIHVVILENVSWKDAQGKIDFARHDAIRSIVQKEYFP